MLEKAHKVSIEAGLPPPPPQLEIEKTSILLKNKRIGGFSVVGN